MHAPSVPMIPSASDPTHHHLWQDELQRVVSSPCFTGATRIRDLLTFLVQETLADRGDRLKEYVIGVEVFGRGTDFDPRVDTNVRTEAWRLRSRLDRYYAEDGAANPARIRLPRRSFIPVLEVLTRLPVGDGLEVGRSVTADLPLSGTPSSTPLPWLHPGRAAASTPLSLVVAGFRDACSGGHRLGRVLTAELLLELGDHPGLRLFAEAEEMGLGCAREAAFQLRGEVFQVGDEVRVVVQLVRRQDGELMWSHGCGRRSSGDIRALPLIAQDIARTLMTSPLARAMGFNRPQTEDGFSGGFVRDILSCGFKRAAIDPAAVRREARRVECWLLHHPDDQAALRRLASLLSWSACIAPDSVPSLAPLLRRCSRELLSQAAPPVDTLVELGLAVMGDFDWFGALELLDKAVRVAPASSDARVVRGLCHLHLGQVAQARLDLETACQVDSASALAHATLGMLHFHQHRFSEAGILARRALSLDAHCEPAAVLLADSELCEGSMDKGIGLLQRARSWSTRRPVILGRLGHIYAVTGRQHLAQVLLRELQAGGEDGVPVHAALADIYLGLGDADAAFEQLGQAVDHRMLPDLLLLHSAPRYDGLRRDVRFRALIDQMALPLAA